VRTRDFNNFGAKFLEQGNGFLKALTHSGLVAIAAEFLHNPNPHAPDIKHSRGFNNGWNWCVDACCIAWVMPGDDFVQESRIQYGPGARSCLVQAG
jgi:hypothetical protein